MLDSPRQLCRSLSNLQLIANDQVSTPTPLKMTATVDFLAGASKCCTAPLQRFDKSSDNWYFILFPLTCRPAFHSVAVLSYDLSSVSDPARSEHRISLTVSEKLERFVCVPRTHQKKVRELTVNQTQGLEDSGLYELAKFPEHQKRLEKKTTKITYAYTKK